MAAVRVVVLGILLLVSVIQASLEPSQLALLINDNDPYSVEIGEYYRVARSIPNENIIHLAFNLTGDTRVMPTDQFDEIKNHVDTILNATAIQAIAIAWVTPSAVQTPTNTQQSITSAFAYGVQPEQASSCSTLSYANPIYDTNITRPWTEGGIRIAMMLGGYNTNDTKALIDRGVQSDGTFPYGYAYVLNTTDGLRDVRIWSVGYGYNKTKYINVSVITTDALVDTTDCIYYCAGTAYVADLVNNTFVPGAIGDHLTSYGGVIPSGFGQMCLLTWIQYGMTGTYGTVIEPCNYASKFPSPGILTDWYSRGDTLIEAYWKSVEMPFQGLFVGEPLARPYGARRTAVVNAAEGFTPSIIVTLLLSSFFLL